MMHAGRSHRCSAQAQRKGRREVGLRAVEIERNGFVRKMCEICSPYVIPHRRTSSGGVDIRRPTFIPDVVQVALSENRCCSESSRRYWARWNAVVPPKKASHRLHSRPRAIVDRAPSNQRTRLHTRISFNMLRCILPIRTIPFVVIVGIRAVGSASSQYRG